MSEFDPDAFLAKRRSPAAPGFDPDAFLAKRSPLGDADSPLRRELEARPLADIVTVETPTGPVRFDRQGRQVMSQEDMARGLDAPLARQKERILEAALSVASGSPLLDEVAGAWSAAKAIPDVVRGKTTLGEAFTKGADMAQSSADAATARTSPEVAVGPVRVPLLPLAGALATTLPAGLPASALGRAGVAGFQGAFGGAAGSRGRLSRGELGEIAKDTGIGTALGLGAGVAGEALGTGTNLLGRALASGAGKAKAALLEATQKAADKAAASARGARDSASAAAMRSIEHIDDVLRNPEQYASDVVEEVRRFAATPEAQEIRNVVATNAPDRLVTQTSKIPNLKTAYSEALEKTAPEAVAEVAGERLAGTPGRILKNAGRSIGQRIALGAGGATIGSLLGDERGTALGALGGVAAPGVLQFLRNSAKDPALQARVAQALMTPVAGVEAVSPYLARASSDLAPFLAERRPKTPEERAAALANVLRSRP